jgi:hypothetical protein
MAVFEEYLYAFLFGEATLQAAFGARIYPLKVPQGETRPSLTYQLHKRDTPKLVAGRTGREDRIYILAVWGAGYTAVKQNAELLQPVLDQQQQQMGPFLVTCFTKDQHDVYDHEAQLYGVETDVQLIFMNYPS